MWDGFTGSACHKPQVAQEPCSLRHVSVCSFACFLASVFRRLEAAVLREPGEDRLLLRAILAMVWGSLRWSDVQHILDSVVLDDDALMGWCWRIKFSVQRMAWAVTSCGLPSQRSFCVRPYASCVELVLSVVLLENRWLPLLRDAGPPWPLFGSACWSEPARRLFILFAFVKGYTVVLGMPAGDCRILEVSAKAASILPCPDLWDTATTLPTQSPFCVEERVETACAFTQRYRTYS